MMTTTAKKDTNELKDAKEVCLILPFKSKIAKKPAAPGARVIKGEWSKRLDNMGLKDWAGEDEPKERQESFHNHLRWDIAHRNFNTLIACININEEYNEASQLLDYEIDLYGDGSVVKKGQLKINRGDYLLYYMRMSKYRRKEAILSRIAISNVGLLVPYVQLDELTYNESRTEVHATYRIVL